MKVFILTTVMAPYRVQLFSEIGKQCELYVCFEQMHSFERNKRWYDKSSANFQLIELEKWDKSIKTIKLEVIKHIRNINPDVVIAYEYHTNTSIMLMSYCQVMKIPYIVNCDGAFISKSIKDIVKRWFISKASGCISSGKMADKYLTHYGALKENIYYNHFTSLYNKDILKYPPTLEDKQFIKKKRKILHNQVILSVGRFVHMKGYDILLKAAANFSEEVGIYIIGGQITSEYKKLVKELNLKNIYFIDFMTKEELKEYYLAADVFVLPTREDVWGLVINEAMSYALPIVTTERCVAGIEMIENGVNGFIVPVENYEDLYYATKKILVNRNLRENMAIENLKSIREYTYEISAIDIISAIKSVYESAYKKKKDLF